jgi:hypothetical protein
MNLDARPGAGGRRGRPPQPKSAREIALNVLYHVDTRKAFADLLLSRDLRSGSLAPRDAALATELVNGTLRWRGRLDWVLGRYVRRPRPFTPWILNLPSGSIRSSSGPHSSPRRRRRRCVTHKKCANGAASP